ncbi:hypothetical protein BB561_003474 [Smittium simulii]|uniref:Uncharacterized protein n=1 Tax=Smittium simulii TaxID=133385 RepID=A0A2T9YLC4_9FUNG|nr:hypothetical protein BB561_003474 [Smittium simulii]
MNYNPPPLNNSELSAVKKTDSAIYGIDLALSQTTRPMHYYAHCKIQNNPTLDTVEHPKTMFASTMRSLLSGTATAQETASQEAEGPASLSSASIVYFQKTQSAAIRLWRRAPTLQPLLSTKTKTASQIFADEVEAAERYLNKNPIRPSDIRASNYWKKDIRSHYEPNLNHGHTADATSTAKKKKSDQKSQQSLNKKDDIPPVKKRYIRGIILRARILQPDLHNSQKYWRPPPRPKLEKTQPLLERAIFSVPDTPFWSVFQPPGLYQVIAPISRIDQVKGNTSLSASRQLNDSGRNQVIVHNQYTFGLLEALGSWTQINEINFLTYPSKLITHFDMQITEGELNDIEMSNKFYWESPVNVSSSDSQTTNAMPSARAQEPFTIEVKIMGFNSNSFGSSNPKPTLLKESTEIMSQALVLA